MKLLEGKTALVTGAARGIGKAIALKFASEGANIAFTDLVLNDEMAAGLEATRKEIEEVGVTCRAYAGNAADFAETEEVVKKIKEDFGAIDILVNNAGITKDGLMLRMTEQQWDAVINVNLKSAFNFIHACIPVMMRQRGGSIINISSVGGLVPDISQVAYGTSKAAINYLTKLIAVQEAKHHIRCNAVLPGMTATEAVEKHLSDDFRNLFLRHIPLGRMGLPEEIAEAVCYFASDASAYTTGQILTVSGGFGLATPVYGDLVSKTVRR